MTSIDQLFTQEIITKEDAEEKFPELSQLILDHCIAWFNTTGDPQTEHWVTLEDILKRMEKSFLIEYLEGMLVLYLQQPANPVPLRECVGLLTMIAEPNIYPNIQVDLEQTPGWLLFQALFENS